MTGRRRPVPAAAPRLAAGIGAALLAASAPHAAAAAPASPQDAPRADRYIGIILGSDHIGRAHLNNVNPGLTYGRIRPLSAPHLSWFWEGGVFRNSYREVSPLLLIGLRYALGRVGPAEITVGASAGTGYYKELSRSLEADYGIPHVGGFVPLAALSLTARVGRIEYRLTTVPAGQDVKAIFNLSVAVHF